MAKIIRKSGTSIEEWPLSQDSVMLSIGRRPDNHVVLPDNFASGRHAIVGFRNGGYFVEDLKSSNGTVLNGQRISHAPLKHGDVIYIGKQRLEFQEDAAAPADAFAATTIASASTIADAQKPNDLPKSPLPGFNFILPVVEPPKPVAAATDTDKDPLEGLARSIRSHRDREQHERQESEERLKGEWEKTLLYAEKLQQKVRNDPRVKYFNISQRSGEISMRVQTDPRMKQQSVVLSCEHPDHKTGTVTGIWLRLTDQPDRCHPTSDAAIAELARAIAFLFA